MANRGILYSTMLPDLRFQQWVSPRHLRVGVSVQTRYAITFGLFAYGHEDLQLCFDCG
jgi:hypothetical protein